MGKITFGNQFIRKAVEDMHLPGDEDKRSAHRWLGEWFDKREVTLDVARERVHQWTNVGDRDRLRACLLEQEIFKELHGHDKSALLGCWVDLGEDVGEVYQKVYGQWTDKEKLSGTLANFLRTAGDYGEFTENLYRHALDGREEGLGSKHPETLKVIKGLGTLLWNKGDLEGAEELYRRALKGFEHARGPDHPHTLGLVNSLGSLLSDKGDNEGAEKFYRRAREKVLGTGNREEKITWPDLLPTILGSSILAGALIFCLLGSGGPLWGALIIGVLIWFVCAFGFWNLNFYLNGHGAVVGWDYPITAVVIVILWWWIGI